MCAMNMCIICDVMGQLRHPSGWALRTEFFYSTSCDVLLWQQQGQHLCCEYVYSLMWSHVKRGILQSTEFSCRTLCDTL